MFAALSSIFTSVRIDGPDYRHRDLPPAPEPPSDGEVAKRAAAVPAVRNRRVYLLRGQEFVVPGPRVASAVERLARTIHPDAFK